MLPVFISDLFSNCKQFDFFVGDDFDISQYENAKNIKFFIKDEHLSNRAKAVLDELFRILGVTEKERPTNYGVVVFDAYTMEHRFTGYPSIALDGNGDIVLRIGSDSVEDEEEALDIPLFYNGQSYFFKLLNKDGIKLKLSPVVTNQGTPDEKTLYYISCEEENRPKFTFIFSFKLQEKTSHEVLTEAWYSGQFETVLTGFSKSGINLSHAFADALQSGNFPENGILMLLVNGIYDEFTDVNNGNKKYQSSKWQIAACSHPNLIVKDYSGAFIPLSQVGMVTASSSCSASKSLFQLREKYGYPQDFKMPAYLLHITGVNMQGSKPRYDWIPKNTGTANFKFFSFQIQKNFAGFLQEIRPIIGNLVEFPVGAKTAKKIEPEFDLDANAF